MVLFFAIFVILETFYLQSILAMARIKRKQNSMTTKSILFMYWRLSRKRRYDESEDEMFIYFFMMFLLVFITIIYPKH